MSEPILTRAELKRQCKAARPGLRWGRPSEGPMCCGRRPNAGGYLCVSAIGDAFDRDLEESLFVAIWVWKCGPLTDPVRGYGVTAAEAIDGVDARLQTLLAAVDTACACMQIGRAP